MSICLHIVYVYITMAELCSCNREPKIYYLALNRKCLTTPHWYNPFSQHHQRAVPPNLACTPQPPREGIPTTSQSNPLFFTALSSRNFWLLFIFQGSPFRPPESANPSLLTSAWMGKRSSPPRWLLLLCHDFTSRSLKGQHVDSVTTRSESLSSSDPS